MVTHYVYILVSKYEYEDATYIQSVHTCETEARREAFKAQLNGTMSYHVEKWSTGPEGEEIDTWYPPSKPGVPHKSREHERLEEQLGKLEAKHSTLTAAYHSQNEQFEQVKAQFEQGDFSFLD